MPIRLTDVPRIAAWLRVGRSCGDRRGVRLIAVHALLGVMEAQRGAGWVGLGAMLSNIFLKNLVFQIGRLALIRHK